MSLITIYSYKSLHVITELLLDLVEYFSIQIQHDD